MPRSCSSRRSRKFMAEMNVVPYIDVMLVLLVIFMVTAPMMQTGVQIELPNENSKPLPANNQYEPLIISIDKKGHFFVNDGSEINKVNLINYIRTHLEENKKIPVYVKADKTVKYDFVMQAIAASQNAGAKNIGLMSDNTKKK